MNMKFNLRVLLLTLIAIESYAIPHPTKSEKIEMGVYKSPIGFEISSGTTGWKQVQTSKANSFIATMYIPNKKNTEASLTVRVDHLNKEVSLHDYIQRWQKEYPKYGFDVMGSKSFQQNSMIGYAIDIQQKESKKQMRQVVFLKDLDAVVITCKDNESAFKDSLKECNQIVRQFKWNKTL